MYTYRLLGRVPMNTLVILCMAMTFGGCVDCKSHVCRVTSKVAYDIYWVRTLCCEEPDNELCREMLPRIPGLTALVVDAKVACDQHNWDRMKQIWNDIRELGLPLPYVKGLWSVICNEDVEVACNSHPFFGPNDSFNIEGTFIRMDPPIRHVDSSDVYSPYERASQKVDRYELSSGSLAANTWLGNDHCDIEGELRLVRGHHGMSSRFDSELCKAFQPTHASFFISGELVQGHLVLDPTYHANILRVDSSGRGLLCGKFHLKLCLREDTSISLDDIFNELWLELPVRMQGASIQIESDRPLTSLELFPVAPKIASILRCDPTANTDSSARNGGCREIGRDAMEVFMNLFPECFTGHSTSRSM